MSVGIRLVNCKNGTVSLNSISGYDVGVEALNCENIEFFRNAIDGKKVPVALVDEIERQAKGAATPNLIAGQFSTKLQPYGIDLWTWIERGASLATILEFLRRIAG